MHVQFDGYRRMDLSVGAFRRHSVWQVVHTLSVGGAQHGVLNSTTPRSRAELSSGVSSLTNSATQVPLR